MKTLMIAGVISLVAALNTSTALAQDLTADSVIASVNGTDITLGHVIVLRQQLPEEYRNLPDNVLFEGILSQIIEQTLLADAAVAGGAEISREVRIALENEERALMAANQIESIVATDITDDQVQALYDEIFGNQEPEPEFNASHILVETEEEALELLVALEGGADFAELAAEKSTGPSGPNGGSLGWFGLGEMVQEFEDAVLLLEVGAVSPVVQTQFGFHVLILNEKRNKPAPEIQVVRPQLMDQLRQQAVEDAIATMTEGADITRPDEDFDAALMRDITLLEE